MSDARGTDRANSGGPPRGRVCCRTAKYPLPDTYRGAIAEIEAYADAMADMFCAYLENLDRAVANAARRHAAKPE